MTLALPHRSIAALVPNFSAAFGHPILSNNGALRLLVRYLDVVSDLDELTNPDIARRISTHIVDLAALALGARGDYAELARLRGGKVARLSAIRSDILQELDRDDLSAELIAARHGISARYVRKLFEHDGSSFSSFVLAERLAKAQRMLADRRYAHLNIAQIAHESGFGDVSYFNRVFRRCFGLTPGAAPTGLIRPVEPVPDEAGWADRHSLAEAPLPRGNARLAIPRPPPYVSAADGCESGFAAFGQPVRPPQQMGSNGPIGGQPEANSLDAAAL